MRTYGEYCPLAKTLDVIGDRWSLLIVRELAIRGSCRYTDIRAGLPGVATNLLAERLRELEAAGVIAREEAPPPVATTLYRLAPRGEELRPVMQALAEWGLPLLAEAPDDDVFLSHWLTLPVRTRLTDATPELPSITIQVRTGDEPMLIETVDGGVRARAGTAPTPDAVISGPHAIVIDVLLGRLDLGEAKTKGLSFEGDANALARVQPRSVGASAW